MRGVSPCTSGLWGRQARGEKGGPREQKTSWRGRWASFCATLIGGPGVRVRRKQQGKDRARLISSVRFSLLRASNRVNVVVIGGQKNGAIVHDSEP